MLTERFPVALHLTAFPFSLTSPHLQDVWQVVQEAAYIYVSAFFLVVSPPSALKVAQHAAETNKV